MAEETVSVVSLRPIYEQVGKLPHPVGSLLKVPSGRAEFWIKRGIARAAVAGEKGAVDPLAAASLRPAPDMKAPPVNPS